MKHYPEEHCLEMIAHFELYKDINMANAWREQLSFTQRNTILEQPTGIHLLIARCKGHQWIGPEHCAVNYNVDADDGFNYDPQGKHGDDNDPFGSYGLDEENE